MPPQGNPGICAKRCALYLAEIALGAGRRRSRTRAQERPQVSATPRQQRRLYAANGLTGWIARHRVPLLIHDLLKKNTIRPKIDPAEFPDSGAHRRAADDRNELVAHWTRQLYPTRSRPPTSPRCKPWRPRPRASERAPVPGDSPPCRGDDRSARSGREVAGTLTRYTSSIRLFSALRFAPCQAACSTKWTRQATPERPRQLSLAT